MLSSVEGEEGLTVCQMIGVNVLLVLNTSHAPLHVNRNGDRQY